MKLRTALLALAAILVLSTAASGASIAVTQAAAVLDGSYGLACTIAPGPASNAFVQDFTPVAETTYRVHFNFRPNSPGGDNTAAFPSPGSRFTVFRAKKTGGAEAFRVTLYRAWATTDLFLFVYAFEDDGSVTKSSIAFPVMYANSTAKVIIEYQTASAPGANDGFLKLYQGTTSNLKGQVLNLDNDTRVVDVADFGCFNQDATNINFVIHLDAFESYRTLAP